jgi:hypothetical protein
MKDADGREGFLSSIVEGRVNVYPAAKAFRAATASARATLVTSALAWMKAYSESAAFKTDYEKRRAQDVPTPPTIKNPDEEYAAKLAEARKNAADSRKIFDQLLASAKTDKERKSIQDSVKQIDEMIANMHQPDTVRLMKQMTESENADAKKRYADDLARHDKRFPADPKGLIARRLRAFLATSQTVDFSAKLAFQFRSSVAEIPG